MSVDPIEAVRTFLLADASTAALVETRVFGQEIGRPDVRKLMPVAAIVLNGSGGPASPGGGFQEYGKERVDAFCYGATLNESRKVYLAAYSALKQLARQKINGVLVHSVTVASKGATALDPVTQWPLTLASFYVLAAEVAAA